MAEQTITLPAQASGANIYEESSSWIRWTFGSLDVRPDIDSSLEPSGETRKLSEVRINADGSVFLNFSDETGASINQDLTSLFETQGSFQVDAGGFTLSVNMAGADLSDPYSFTPDNSDEVTAFYTSVHGLPGGVGSLSGTLILRDFEPITFSGAWEGIKITGGAWEGTKLVGGAWGGVILS